MKPTIEQLHQSGQYELIESFHVDDMGKFLMRELGMKQPKAGDKSKMGWKLILPLLVFGGIGGLVGYQIGGIISKYVIEDNNLVIQFIGSFVFMFVVLLPVHECIHALAFKQIGAAKVGFGWSKKSLIVYAYAQKFVMTLRENAYVAVMPFVVITISLVAGWLFAPQWFLFWFFVLFLHTTACIGDFILIGYYYKNKAQTHYTYDDIEGEKMSYFFRKKE
jgi:hypothetical protein